MNYSFNVKVTLMNGDQLEFFNVDELDHTDRHVYQHSKCMNESAIVKVPSFTRPFIVAGSQVLFSLQAQGFVHQ